MMDDIPMAGLASRHGNSWSQNEDERLITAFKTGVSVATLSQCHERGEGAIRSRLQRLGLITPDSINTPDNGATKARDTENPETPLNRLTESIDHLISALQDLRQLGVSGTLGRRTIGSITRSYERLNDIILQECLPVASQDAELPSHDPLPDRLREAFLGIVIACVPNIHDRYIAIKLLGLDGDGERVTLQQIGDEFDRTRERIRQRRNRAFLSIVAALPKRIASTTHLRAVLSDVSKQADWTQPAQAARTVVTLVNDNFIAAKQLTLMLLLAAGATGKIAQLRKIADRAALEACQDSRIFGRWQLDRWADATEKAIIHGSFANFSTLPPDMKNAQRSTYQGTGSYALSFQSEKLRRVVECESGMEASVYQWLEKSSEVLVYQEQPVAIPYNDYQTPRSYYPDAAVLDTYGRLIVVEVKPVYNMFRISTLRKCLGAITYFHDRGIGYLMVDSRGRTLMDLALRPYDIEQAQAIEDKMNGRYISYMELKEAALSKADHFDFLSFASMVVNRDWCVTNTPVRISKLQPELSFKPMLAKP